MPNLRMILVEAECSPAEAAQIVRLAMLGEQGAELSNDAPAPALARVAIAEEREHQPEPEPEPVLAAPQRQRKQRKAAPERPAAPVAAIEDGTFKERILSALAKKPLSSLELAQKLGVEPTKVYSPLSLMKGKGEVESFQDDDTDGLRRYRLPK